MPYIDAVIFSKWKQDADGNNVPDVIDEIYAWAIANDEYLPEGQSGKGPFGRWSDVCGQANVHQRILDDLAVFVGKLEITVNTAQHFANDARLFVLGYRRLDDEGNVLFSNWNEPLSSQERQKAAQYVTSHCRITAQQLAQAFDATDTRLEIARKLKAFFRQ